MRSHQPSTTEVLVLIHVRGEELMVIRVGTSPFAVSGADTDIIYASHVINQHTDPNPSSTEIDVTQPLIERFF